MPAAKRPLKIVGKKSKIESKIPFFFSSGLTPTCVGVLVVNPPALLNLFCGEGLESLKICTPWSLLEKSLSLDRYKIMEDKFYDEFVNS